MRLRRTLRLLAVAALLAVAGCATAPAPLTAAISVQSDRLFFGRDIPAGGAVTDADWAAFLNEIVTPRLPAGFTVYRTEGQYRNNDGSIAREAGFVLQVDHPAGQPGDQVFEEIAAEYCRRFRQEAVMRIRSPAEQWMYRSGAR